MTTTNDNLLAALAAANTNETVLTHIDAARSALQCSNAELTDEDRVKCYLSEAGIAGACAAGAGLLFTIGYVLSHRNHHDDTDCSVDGSHVETSVANTAVTSNQGTMPVPQVASFLSFTATAATDAKSVLEASIERAHKKTENPETAPVAPTAKEA